MLPSPAFWLNFYRKSMYFFSRNPPFPKIVTFPLEQKGCHYYELAQYKIVTTAPYVNFCSLKDFFVSSSGFFVIQSFSSDERLTLFLLI